MGFTYGKFACGHSGARYGSSQTNDYSHSCNRCMKKECQIQEDEIQNRNEEERRHLKATIEQASRRLEAIRKEEKGQIRVAWELYDSLFRR